MLTLEMTGVRRAKWTNYTFVVVVSRALLNSVFFPSFHLLWHATVAVWYSTHIMPRSLREDYEWCLSSKLYEVARAPVQELYRAVNSSNVVIYYRRRWYFGFFVHALLPRSTGALHVASVQPLCVIANRISSLHNQYGHIYHWLPATTWSAGGGGVFHKQHRVIIHSLQISFVASSWSWRKLITTQRDVQCCYSTRSSTGPIIRNAFWATAPNVM